jgi:aspartyl/asparaginyl-tRNA synthetase
MSRVYSLSTTFRSEQSRMQNKHLSEFTMFEAEEAFVESLDSLMDRVESICKFVTYYAAQHCKDDFKVIFDKTKSRDLDKIANSKYIR